MAMAVRIVKEVVELDGHADAAASIPTARAAIGGIGTVFG